MSDSDFDRDVQTTLRDHSEFVHRLARRLVLDPHVASDVVQETWLAFLRAPPDPRRPLEGWFQRVVRNKLLERRRAEGRRQQHEVHAARSVEKSSSDVSAERQELERAVMRAVSELP